MRVPGLLASVILTFLAMIDSRSVSATSHLVNAEGSGDYPTIQAAIDASASGDTVALVQGVFTGSGNRDVLFRGKAIVVRSLDGDPDLCTVDAQGTANDQHRGFLFVGSEGPSSVLEEITIRGGFWRNNNDDHDQGGGILCGPNSAPTIRNCVFAANRSIMGAGLLVGAGSHPSIQGCRFEGNQASGSGGAIGCDFYNRPARFIIRNCSFANNIANGYAGVITIYSRTDITDCIFTNNHGAYGGVFYVCEGGRGYFDRCTFIGNDSDMGGAGLT